MTGRPLQLLIVEDDPGLLEEFSRTAASWGYLVLKAATLRDGIRQLERAPDLVLLEVDLRRGTAMEFVEVAQEIEPFPGIVIVTGEAGARETFDLRKAGVRALVMKPVRPEDLREALIRAMAPPGPRAR